MHEFLLFSQIGHDGYQQLLHQLTGVTRMQPQPIKEVHIVFKGRFPPGLSGLPSTTTSQAVMAPEVQRTKTMLGASLFYLQLVGQLSNKSVSSAIGENDDIVMLNGGVENHHNDTRLRWTLEFRDFPDAGKQAVTTRLISSIPIEGGDILRFMKSLGYDFVSQYVIEGDKFYDQETTLFVHRALVLPTQELPKDMKSFTDSLAHSDELKPLDGDGSYVVEASLRAIDGNNPELKERAVRQLLAMKETLKQAVNLLPGDRLAMDTRVPMAPRR